MRSAVLIRSARHTARDIAQWDANESVDAIVATSRKLSERTAVALDDMAAFAALGRCYVGVSWGKDSVVVAHLAATLSRLRGLRIPIVWVRREPVDNPECSVVRDAFMRAHGMWLDLHEIRVDCERDPLRPECWWPVGVTARTATSRPKQIGFARAAAAHGDRYISGVRAAESGQRVSRMRSYGVSTARTCAPIGWWSTAEVFAYLLGHALPVHPAYAYTAGGMYQRDRLRVGSIGSHHGQGHGRAEWEMRYYPEIARLTHAAAHVDFSP
ncbi:MAG: phosphoadenosine phosphosulfate reductase family protein [Actinobacteria bacterium]|nr:phosphoadenosine phosphosulfate reductase family protein [Actinomycetota bacterium]